MCLLVFSAVQEVDRKKLAWFHRVKKMSRLRDEYRGKLKSVADSTEASVLSSTEASQESKGWGWGWVGAVLGRPTLTVLKPSKAIRSGDKLLSQGGIVLGSSVTN